MLRDMMHDAARSCAIRRCLLINTGTYTCKIFLHKGDLSRYPGPFYNMQALRAQTSRSPQTYSKTCPILSRELTRCTTRRPKSPGDVPTRVSCAQRQSQQQGVEASRAVTSATPDAPEPVVERVSNSSGSRKAFAKVELWG